ncbi:MAG: transcriptional regulator, AraC family with amidase-like domain, partial [Rhodoferax sp.]|nr:transcriptional regulator, AraC family with amidase-like domain [Rhodoferax sp.]
FKLNPAQYYMNLRLRRAQELLTHSSQLIMQVTVACGFQSSSHFCKAYRGLFGHSPSEERRRSATAAPVAKAQGAARGLPPMAANTLDPIATTNTATTSGRARDARRSGKAAPPREMAAA